MQSEQVVEPALVLVYLPALQSMQSVMATDPVPAVVLPESQLTHCVLSLLLLHLPRAQVKQAPPSAVSPNPTLHSMVDAQPVRSSFANGAGDSHAVHDVWPGLAVYLRAKKSKRRVLESVRRVQPSACASERMCKRAHVQASACASERMCKRAHVQPRRPQGGFARVSASRTYEAPSHIEQMGRLELVSSLPYFPATQFVQLSAAANDVVPTTAHAEQSDSESWRSGFVPLSLKNVPAWQDTQSKPGDAE
jgi:hypothetical protein